MSSLPNIHIHRTKQVWLFPYKASSIEVAFNDHKTPACLHFGHSVWILFAISNTNLLYCSIVAPRHQNLSNYDSYFPLLPTHCPYYKIRWIWTWYITIIYYVLIFNLFDLKDFIQGSCLSFTFFSWLASLTHFLDWLRCIEVLLIGCLPLNCL